MSILVTRPEMEVTGKRNLNKDQSVLCSIFFSLKTNQNEKLIIPLTAMFNKKIESHEIKSLKLRLVMYFYPVQRL